LDLEGEAEAIEQLQLCSTKRRGRTTERPLQATTGRTQLLVSSQRHRMPSVSLCAEDTAMQPFHSVSEDAVVAFGVQLSQDLYGSRATFWSISLFLRRASSSPRADRQAQMNLSPHQALKRYHVLSRWSAAGHVSQRNMPLMLL
jgi:hypothetical protein